MSEKDIVKLIEREAEIESNLQAKLDQTRKELIWECAKNAELRLIIEELRRQKELDKKELAQKSDVICELAGM